MNEICSSQNEEKDWPILNLKKKENQRKITRQEGQENEGDLVFGGWGKDWLLFTDDDEFRDNSYMRRNQLVDYVPGRDGYIQFAQFARSLPTMPVLDLTFWMQVLFAISATI